MCSGRWWFTGSGGSVCEGVHAAHHHSGSRQEGSTRGPSSLRPPKSLSTERFRRNILHPFGHAAAMSRASKLTLAATSLGAIGIVVFVHYSQRAEKAVRQP